MPGKALRPCKYTGCRELTAIGYCNKHKAEIHQRYDRYRGSSAERGYDAKWRRYREVYLKGHPLCVECLKTNKITAATVVDHIIPHKGDKKLFWDVQNHQALCKLCHDRRQQEKTAVSEMGKNDSVKLLTSEFEGSFYTNCGKMAQKRQKGRGVSNP